MQIYIPREDYSTYPIVENVSSQFSSCRDEYSPGQIIIQDITLISMILLVILYCSRGLQFFLWKNK